MSAVVAGQQVQGNLPDLTKEPEVNPILATLHPTLAPATGGASERMYMVHMSHSARASNWCSDPRGLLIVFALPS